MMPMFLDEALGQMIRQRLLQDKRTAGLTVDVCCSNGCICLVGHVDSRAQKDAALFLIEGLPGVRSVSDQMIIRDRLIA